MHDSTGITASSRQTKTRLNALSNPCATPALSVPDRGLVYASESMYLACTRDFDHRTRMEQALPLMTGEGAPKNKGEDYSWYVLVLHLRRPFHDRQSKSRCCGGALQLQRPMKFFN
jgi:hypothetical protein